VAPISPGAGPPPRRLLRGGERLQHIVGARLLVGVTVREPDGTVVSRTQFCGVVLEVADGVVVVDKDGEPALLPSDDLAYTSAPRGTYTLSGSGEVVVDPDYVTTWDVTATPPGEPVVPDAEVDGKTEIELDVPAAEDVAPDVTGAGSQAS
jgi:hypothetical protein